MLLDTNSVVLDQNGYVYLGGASEGSGVEKFDSSGQLLTFHGINPEPRYMDLAADQCTLYYTSNATVIKRFDLCSDTPLTDFASGFGTSLSAAKDLRIRPNGEVILADYDEVLRFDANGQVIQHYGRLLQPTYTGISLDPDGTS
ncbi:MAG: hypothetical protein DMG61_15095, partial [Acidobacteria bacterium]